jgi:predicted transcriptional regulator of viral defense system
MEARVSVGKALRDLGRPVFTTREVAAIRGGSVSATSQALGRLEGEGRVTRVTRGVWCDPDDPRFTRFALVHFLVGGNPTYVSFSSALHLQGIVEQIPQIVYAATTAHTSLKRTPVGSFSFHRIDPRFFDGFDWYRGGDAFLIAEPEKALVDSLYLASRRGKRFGRFPELDLEHDFSFARAEEWVRRIPYRPIRRYVERELRYLQE